MLGSAALIYQPIMPEWTPSERPEALRERAQWYRDYATVCGGDNAWALRLAEHFDRLADERERALGAGGESGPREKLVPA
jgi:hypothetical protein